MGKSAHRARRFPVRAEVAFTCTVMCVQLLPIVKIGPKANTKETVDCIFLRKLGRKSDSHKNKQNLMSRLKSITLKDPL